LGLPPSRPDALAEFRYEPERLVELPIEIAPYPAGFFLGPEHEDHVEIIVGGKRDDEAPRVPEHVQAAQVVAISDATEVRIVSAREGACVVVGSSAQAAR